ncbi:MAG: enhanced intracellular survival protein Eis [Promethearchaeota archaeon]
MPSTIRQCSKEDMESVLSLVAYAYSFPESSLERYRELLTKSHKEYYLNEVDGEPVATARVLSLKQNFRGTFKPMIGIGMVASSPEHRRRGHVRDLMKQILVDFRKEGFAVSTLYPFKDTFYTALGYVKMPPTHLLEVNPNQLSRISKPEGYRASREEGGKAFQAWRLIHDAAIGQIHGGALRSDFQWKNRTDNFRSKLAIARNKEGDPEGVMVYSVKGYGTGHEWAEEGSIVIHEMHWSTLEGRDTLLNYIYLHADQIVNVKMNISSRTDDYYHWTSDLHTLKVKANIVTMARIIDIEKSMRGFQVKEAGEVIVEVRDPDLDWNNGSFRLWNEDGTLECERVDSDATARTSIEGLTSILYGTLGMDSLRRMAWLEGETPKLLSEWFSRQTPWLTEEF